MKTARFRDAQITGILKQAEGGTLVSELGSIAKLSFLGEAAGLC